MVCVTTLLSSTFLVLTFALSGDIKTRREARNLLLRSRNLLDFSKVALSNALLLRLLQMEKWEMLIALFLLNYVVSISFYSKSQSAQHKYERDKFEQMAYRDFLTGTYNRAHMDKMMKELNQSGEYIGIVVADIDRFKKSMTATTTPLVTGSLFICQDAAEASAGAGCSVPQRRGRVHALPKGQDLRGVQDADSGNSGQPSRSHRKCRIRGADHPRALFGILRTLLL